MDQQALQAASAEMLSEYRARVAAEVSNPARIAAVYGPEFAGGNVRSQACTVAQMASQMLRVSAAQVNLITGEEQYALASFNGPAPGPDPVEDSFCQNVIGTGRPFEVNDAREHPVVCATSFVESGSILSYLGVPIFSHDSMIVGTLCVFDTRPRRWRVSDVDILSRLAGVITRAATAAATAAA